MKRFTVVLLALLAGGAYGQVNADTIRLGQVVVTASQHAVSRNEAPAVVGVIGSGDLERYAATNLAEGLDIETGVRVENTCQNCGANEVRINGLGGAYSQVLVDSRPVNSALAGVYLLELLPSAMIDRVEVMRGGGSALYGSNAIAGVINVITKEPRRNQASVGNTTSLVGGRAADYTNRIGASVVTDNRRAGLSLYGQNRHRWPYDHDGDGYSELGELKAQMLGFNGYLRTSDYSKLTLEYHHLYEYRRGGDRFDLPSPLAHISEGGEHRINSGNLKWDWFPGSGRSRASLYLSAQHVDRQSYYGERDDDDPIGTAYGYTTDLTFSDGLRFAHSFDRLWFMPAELTAGVEHTYDRLADRTLNADDTLRQTVNDISAYVQNEWRTYRCSLLVGARVDKHSMVRRPVLTPRLALRYAPSDHLVLRTGYSAGFRAPQVFDDDLHAGAVQGELYKITNAADLRMERSHSVNASVDWCAHLGRVEADLMVEAFCTRIGDAFVTEWLYDDTLGGYRHYERRNADGAVVRGLNAEVRLSPMADMQLQLGGTWQRSRYEGRGLEWAEGRYERRIERSPDLYAYLSGCYTPVKNLGLSLTGTFTGPMLVYHAVDEDEVVQVTTPSFLDLSLRVAYSIPLGGQAALELSAGVRNLLNSYQDDFDRGPHRDSAYIYGPTQPRTLYAGAKLEL